MFSRGLIGIIVLILFLGLLLLVTRAYTTSFRVSTIATRGTMLAALLIPFFFVLSVISGRGARGLSPALYTIIQIIVSLGFYVFLGGIMLLLLQGIFHLFHIPLPLYVPKIFLCISLLLGIAGLVQARFITVKDYTVALQNLPEAMEGKKAILVSDTHFGQVNHARFSDKVVSRIISLRPDFVLHAGDFYDGPTVPTESITASWSAFTKEGIPVFYAPGNHEMYGNYGAFVKSVSDAGVTVLDDKKVNYNDITIAGITYREGKDSLEAAQAIDTLNLSSETPVILINHPPTSLEKAESSGVSLMVSGHTHNGQFWPNTYLVRMVYGAFSYGLQPYERMQVLTTSGVGTFGPPLRLFNSPELVRITFVKK